MDYLLNRSNPSSLSGAACGPAAGAGRGCPGDLACIVPVADRSRGADTGPGAGRCGAGGRGGACAAGGKATTGASDRTPEIWKNATRLRKASTCDAICSAVAESSSAEEALRWVTSSTFDMARFICATPVACSPEAAATSCTSSAVFLIEASISWICAPDRSAVLTDDPATPRIS